MNLGQTSFAQLTDFRPYKIHRLVDCHDGERYVKPMLGTEQFLVPTFFPLAKFS